MTSSHSADQYWRAINETLPTVILLSSQLIRHHSVKIWFRLKKMYGNHHVDTLRPRQKAAIFFLRTFKKYLIILIWIIPAFVPIDIFDNKYELVQIKTWRLKGDTPLCELMIFHRTDACMCHLASLNKKCSHTWGIRLSCLGALFWVAEWIYWKKLYWRGHHKTAVVRFLWSCIKVITCVSYKISRHLYIFWLDKL